jgi:hypothetical protein
MKLIAIFRQFANNWDATIKDHTYIQVHNAHSIEEARMFLEMYIAEEFPRTRWEIVEEIIS